MTMGFSNTWAIAAPLFAVCGFAVAVLMVVRRFTRPMRSKDLELLARVTLEPRRAVYLVRAVETVYLIAISEGGVAKLGEMPMNALQATTAPEVGQ